MVVQPANFRSILGSLATPGCLPGSRLPVVSKSKLDFHRRRVVVADEASQAAAFLIDTLRLDGHRVTHLSDVQAATFDLALDDCHLFVCGSSIGGMRAVRLIGNLRDTAPDLPI